MKTLFSILVLFIVSFSPIKQPKTPIRVLVVTGGHGYNESTFNEMFSSFGNNATFQVISFPEAYDMFLPENRSKYDVLVFYNMWQKINEEQKKTFADCIAGGKPLVVLHHSICAFDNWEEYINIIGGKYFHTPTVIKGKTYQPSSYIHDLHFTVQVADKKHPVTNGVNDFEVFDETYDNYYVSPEVHPLLTTNEPSSTPVIGWTHKYGKARVVTLQSGHDSPTFQNSSFKKLLWQSINWVYAGNQDLQ